jgi:hypothetical protein
MPPDLKKLTIHACTVDQGKVSVGSAKFVATLNPSSYSHKRTLHYDSPRKRPFGSAGQDPKFAGVGNDTVGFALMLDGTGVVSGGGSAAAPPRSVTEQIRALNSIVYAYDGQKHEPNVVRLLWGTFIFFGRLTSMSTEYTLFKPEGEPLRAKVDLSFTGFMSKEEQALVANRSSPDLSHKVVVKAGDTLPLLCYRIYKDSGYYMDVARHNGLTDFRRLEPGSTLRFPPLRSP